MCWNKEECVPRKHLCDGVQDCSDGSDEDICGKLCNLNLPHAMAWVEIPELNFANSDKYSPH